MISIDSKFRGFYKLEAVRPDGRVRLLADWFENHITNQGLDQIGSAPVVNTSYGIPYLNTHCEVGTGSTAPTDTDTAIEAPVAMYPDSASSNVEGGTKSYVAGPPSYWKCVWMYSFPTGVAAGNLAEVGVGGCLSGDTHVRCFSRSLIEDSGGNPTTITVQADEVLRVTYELRLYFDTDDHAFSVVIDGVTYNGTKRRAGINTAASFDVAQTYSGALTNVWLATYSGAIGSVTSQPSGSSGGGINGSSTTAQTYQAGTHYRDYSSNFSLSQSNFAIAAILLNSPHGQFQYSLSPSIQKDGTKTMRLDYRWSWGRYP